jgi:hypothetical protein
MHCSRQDTRGTTAPAAPWTRFDEAEGRVRTASAATEILAHALGRIEAPTATRWGPGCLNLTSGDHDAGAVTVSVYLAISPSFSLDLAA